MADNTKETAQEKKEEKPKKKGLLKWILLAVIVLVLAGGGWFGYSHFFAKQDHGNATGHNATDNATHGEGENGESQVKTFALEPFVVNLADPVGRRYLKVSMEFEVKDEAAVAELEHNMSKIKDAVLLLLSSKSFNDLVKMEDKILLKNQTADRVNQILGRPLVLRVYFTEFVIQ